MPDLVISDTSCLIAIEKTAGLELLWQLYAVSLKKSVP